MAGIIYSVNYYRNYNNSDSTNISSQGVLPCVFPNPTTDGFANPKGGTTIWEAPEGTEFIEWNTQRDGSGTSISAGYSCNNETEMFLLGTVYAIWGVVSDPIDYLTTDQELTSIANAIRTKGGTSESLSYPDEFISAIEAIETGVDISDTTAAAGDVLSPKYFYTANGTKTQGTISTRTSSDLTANGATVIVPGGYYASQVTKAVSNGSATTPATSITANPTISVNSTTGVISASVSGSKSVTPTVSAGYVSSGTAGTVSISGSNTSQLSTVNGTTVSPTETEQTAVTAGKYTLGAVKVGAIPSTYVGSGIDQNDSTDLTVSGATVTAPAGYYAENASKTVSSGSVTQNAPTVNTSTGVVTATASVTAGYVASDTKSNTLSLPALSAATFNTSSSDQEIPAAKYLTGKQTIKAVTTSGIEAGNIKDGVTVTVGDANNSGRIKNIAGSFTDASTVSSGQTAAGATQIRSGYSAWVDGAEVKGSLGNTSVSQGTTTVTSNVATRGTATWDSGVIASGSIGAATFGNSVATGKTASSYVDISSTTEAPVLVSGGYMYINKGYTDDLKISLAKLVPDGASADLASNKILSGYSAYNNDGTLVAGNIPTKSSSDLSASGKTVTVPAGYYANQYTKDVATGTEGTPTASKGSVSNHAVSVTPSVTNTAGYISGGTKTGTAVTVSASELVSGTLTISSSGTKDVTNYASASVAAGSATTPETDIVIDPEITVDSSTGIISFEVDETHSITPTVSAGYVSAGTAGDVKLGGTFTLELTTQDEATITPTEEEELAVAAGKYTLGNIVVAPISSTYVGSDIARKSSTDLSASGATVTVPAGYYASQATKSVSSGTEGTPTATKGTVSGNSISVTPSVTNTAGYISGGTKTGTAVTVSASELVSGTKSITASGTTDVTNYANASVSAGTITNNTSGGTSTGTINRGSQIKIGAGFYNSDTYYTAQANSGTKSITSSGTTSVDGYANVSVAAGSAITPSASITANPTISVNASGLITASNSKAQSVTPTVSAGYVSSGTAGIITVVGSNTSQLTVQAAQTITPTTTDQTIASGKYLTGTQTIKGDANLVAANIASGTTIFGVTGSFTGEFPAAEGEYF